MAEGLAYDYAPARAYAINLGLPRFDEEFLPTVDRHFKLIGLTDEQVTEVVNLYSWTQAHYWNPTTYTWRQRLGLAYHFLFRRGL